MRHRHDCCDETTEDLLACLIARLLCRERRREVVLSRRITFGAFQFSAEGKTAMFIAKDDVVPAPGTYSFKFVDSKGKPAKVDTSAGPPTISAAAPSIVDSIGPVTDNGDGTFSAPFHMLDNIGSSQVTVTADVDLGDGVSSKDFVDVFQVIAGDASVMQGTATLGPPDTPTPTPGP
jgi:hypothetical protein